jgi:hypothetical protein
MNESGHAIDGDQLQAIDACHQLQAIDACLYFKIL